MDLLCSHCGEPWEFHTLHEETDLRFLEKHGYNYATYRERLVERAGVAGRKTAEGLYQAMFKDVSAEFRGRGCQALRLFRGSDEPCVVRGSNSRDRADLAAAAYDLLGDDLDGAAAMLEDYGV